MIVVKVELWSARTGEITELARMLVDNRGGTEGRCDYRARTLRGRSRAQFDRTMASSLGPQITSEADITGHDRKRLHVWHLIGKALNHLGYGA